MSYSTVRTRGCVTPYLEREKKAVYNIQREREERREYICLSAAATYCAIVNLELYLLVDTKKKRIDVRPCARFARPEMLLLLKHTYTMMMFTNDVHVHKKCGTIIDVYVRVPLHMHVWHV